MNTLKLAEELIRCRSITPDDADCQKIITDRLTAIGFSVEHLKFGDVSNIWAQYGTEKPLLAFAGHTDVVPPGPLDEWNSDPFTPEQRQGNLYGRGAADMKSSLAAMVVATEKFIAENPSFNGSLGFLITSDEEGPAINGTVKVLEWLNQNNIHIDNCIVGEPSSSEYVGDVIKNGRRGSLSGMLKVIGKQGHVAYPHLAENPIHIITPALQELCEKKWDTGNQYFPPTTFQISNINSGTGASNVIPGELSLHFNFRYSTETNAETLQSTVESILQKHSIQYDLNWSHSGKPFLTPEGMLCKSVQNAILEVTGKPSTLSTAGGTSDGRFIAPTGAAVIELGPVNASIHKINEHINIQQLELLTKIYYKALKNILL